MEIAAALFFSATALYTKWLSNREQLGHYQTLFPMMLFSLPLLFGSTLIFEWSHPLKFYWKTCWPSAARVWGLSSWPISCGSGLFTVIR